MPVDLYKINSKAIYTVQEVAQIIQKKEQTIRLYINTGKLKAIKGQDGMWRIRGSEINRFLNGDDSAGR